MFDVLLSILLVVRGGLLQSMMMLFTFMGVLTSIFSENKQPKSSAVHEVFGGYASVPWLSVWRSHDVTSSTQRQRHVPLLETPQARLYKVGHVVDALAWFLCCATVPHDKLPGVQRGGLEDQHADDCNVVSRDRSSTTKVIT